VAAYRFRAHLTERPVAALVDDGDNHTSGEISVHRHTRLTVTLTVTGAKTGELREMRDARIRLKQAVFETPANTGKVMKPTLDQLVLVRIQVRQPKKYLQTSSHFIPTFGLAYPHVLSPSSLGSLTDLGYTGHRPFYKE
jgi:hypothetical protein